MRTIENIGKDLGLLPEKDRKICQDCLEQRDFDRLLEIVDSHMIKLRRLQSAVEEYAAANDLPTQYGDIFNDEAYDIE